MYLITHCQICKTYPRGTLLGTHHNEALRLARGEIFS
jgi:hypothetical protein